MINDETIHRIPVIVEGKKGFLNKEAKKITFELGDEEHSIIWNILHIPEYKKENIDLEQLYNDMITVLHELFVLPNEIEYKILALWIFATWKVHNFHTVPFLSIISIPNTGKTRILNFISQTANKAIVAGESTASVIPRLTDKYGLTILIDEVHDKAKNTELLGFCRSSYKRGSFYLKSKKETDSDIVALSNFGFKAFAGENEFKTYALSTRCIDISPMKESPSIQKISYRNKEIKSIRDKCLLFRMQDSVQYDLGNDYTTLTGRTRELFEPLIIVAKHLGQDYHDVEEYALQHEELKKEEASESVDIYVFNLIYEEMQQTAKVFVSNIVDKLDWRRKTGDDRRNSSARLGYILKAYNIRPKGQGFFNRYIDTADEDTRKRIISAFKRFNIQGYKEEKKDVVEYTI